MPAIDGAEPLLSEHLPRLLTVSDVADVLGVNERTIRRFVALIERGLVEAER